MTKYYIKTVSLIIFTSLFLACAETNKKGEDLKKQTENDLKIIAYVHGW